MNKDVFRKLRQMLMEELDLSRELSDKEILDVIDELILNQIKDVRLALKEKVQLRQELFYSVRKLDVLQELVDDETVTEIMVNGPDTIFVERAGKLMKWHKSFTSAEKLEDVIQQIVGKCNRVIHADRGCKAGKWFQGKCCNLSGCIKWSDSHYKAFS